MSILPQGWAETAGGTVFEYVRGVTYQKQQARDVAENGFIGILRATNIQDGALDNDNLIYVPSDLVSEKQTLRLGDQVIAASSGSISVVGKAAPVSNQIVGLSFGAFCAVARPRSFDVQDWLRLFFQSPEYRQFVSDTAMGNNINNLRSSDLVAIKLPLPPLPEQRRIVAKVDGLTARTARARKELDRIPTLIARYKQRLLALAFSGELTAGWRRGKELPQPSPALLADVVAIPVRNGLSVRGSDIPPGVRALRLSALRGAEVNLDDVRYLPIGPEKASRFLLSEGDILISRGNGTRAYVGIGSRVPEVAEDTIFPDTAFRIRLAPTRAISRWFVSIWNSPQVREQIENAAKTTAGIWKVAQSDLARIELLLPTMEEQAEIVRRIESAFGWLDRMAADHAAAARLLPKLDAAILAKAFQGKLVPQDPNDEPAAKLLERIKAEREAEGAKPKSRRTRKPNLPPISVTASGEFRITGSATASLGRKRAGKDAMTKSRQDGDVKDKPYLAGLLKSSPRSDVQSLFRAADLPVADFYKQLAWEIEKGHILDNAEELKAA